MSKFFDFHLHVVLKNQFATEENPTSPWEKITAAMILKHIPFPYDLFMESFASDTLASQSSPPQLLDKGYKLVCHALFSPDIELLKSLKSNNKFKKFIEEGKLAPYLTDEQFLKIINKNSSPFQFIKKDLELIKQVSPDGNSIALIQKSNEFDEGEKKLSAVFTIEGLHCLRNNMLLDTDQNITNDILQNLDKLRTTAKIISINLTHIDNNNNIFSSCAYAYDGLKDTLDDKMLRPFGNGLPNTGLAIVEEIYNRKILVDIKHMSIASRLKFYDEIDKGNIQKHPIICSHGGFTGCWFNSATHDETYNDYVFSVRKVGNNQKLLVAKPIKFKGDLIPAAFNASSINLYNEDIVRILQSGGIIGISMDQRVLGFHNKVSRVAIDNPNELYMFDTEYFSLSDFQTVQKGGAFGRKVADDTMDFALTSKEFIAKTPNPVDFGDLHFKHFVMHILHAINIAREFGGEAAVLKLLLAQICIGSDFDGMIDGLDSCKTVEDMPTFKQKFIDEFKDYADDAGVILPNTLTIQQIADRIFYENGRDFILKRLDILNS